MNINKNRRTMATIVASISLATTIAGCAPNPPVRTGGATPAHTSTSASTSATTVTPAPGHVHASASPGGGMSHDMGSKGMEALSSLNGKDFDIAFLSQMIAHHQGAIDMARQTLAVAKMSETKAEAQKVIDAQTTEIAQMREWLKAWYGLGPVAEQQALMKDDMKGMMSMPITEDKMFYQMMIPHHEGAISMSEMVEAKSEMPELKEMAKKIIADQQSEIQTYQTLMSK